MNESKDISVIRGISIEKRQLFKNFNINTLGDLLEWNKTRNPEIPTMRGNEIYNHICSATAWTTNEIVRKSKKPHLDKRSTEIFLDMKWRKTSENDSDGSKQINYFIEVLRCKEGKEEFRSFVANGYEGEKEMFNEFIDFVKEQENYVVYYWRHRTKTHFDEMRKKYDIPDDIQKLLGKYEVQNLQEITEKLFAFPFSSMDLREVSERIGFEWTKPEEDVENLVASYREYVMNSDKVSLEFLQDDSKTKCKAIKSIKDWLKKKEEK